MADRSDQERIRRQRRQEAIDHGLDVYPAKSQRTTTIGSVLATWKLDRPVTVAGRIRAIRGHGGSTFIDLEDESGKIQVLLDKSSDPSYATSVKSLDLGDFIDVQGLTFATKKKQPTIKAAGPVRLLVKTLRPLPSKWYGLEDIEQRYRYRELDLLANPKVKAAFTARATALASLRAFLAERDFLEVETPVLQPLAGGATARPFVTHHHALDVDLYLRVAPELYLKRLIIGGYGRVYEIARCFRNEGIDRDHNPEFTQVEVYAAYADYEWMMNFVEELVIRVATAVNGRPRFTVQEKTYGLKKPFRRIPYRQAILTATGIDLDAISNPVALAKVARAKGTDIPTNAPRSKIIDELFKTHVRPGLIEPTIIFDYPLELSPLAKKKPDSPGYTERFQLLMGGTELANAFSELNDPIDQRQRFEMQEQLRAAGDEEAQRLDETYLASLEYGLPPTAGLGLGIDRLMVLLTGQRAIKDVILFPTLKPQR